MITAHYLGRVVRLWWVTALAIALAVGVAILAQHHQRPKYVAFAQVSVGYTGSSSAGHELEAHNLSNVRAVALADLASRPPVIRRAMQQAGVTGSLPAVVAGPYGDSALVNIVVTDADPVRAAKVANGFAAVLPSELVRLLGPLDRDIAVHVTARAVPPGPSSPGLTRFLAVGVAGGTALGLLVVAVILALDRSVRDSDDLVRATGRPLLGVVPHGVHREELPLRTRPATARARGYRNLRVPILALGSRVLSVTSTSPGEGRTTLVANLAIALQATGSSVLLVEADLRRPRLARLFGAANTPGLAQVLDGRAAVRDAIQHPGGGSPSLLVAGEATRVEADLFVGSAFADVIAAVRDDFDLVLIDAPNVELNATAVIVSAAADATILLARIGRSTPAGLGSTLASLRMNGARVAGVVANASRGGSAADAQWSLSARSLRVGLRRG